MRQGVARSSEGNENSFLAGGSSVTAEGVERKEGFFLRGYLHSQGPSPRFEGCSEKQSHRVAWPTAEGGKEMGAPHRTQRSLGELGAVRAGTWSGAWPVGTASKTGVWGSPAVETGSRRSRCRKGYIRHALLSNRMFSATFSSSPDVLNTPGLPKGLKVTLRPRLWVLVA